MSYLFSPVYLEIEKIHIYMTRILIGEFMKFKPLHDRVLIEVLDSSEKTAGGIITVSYTHLRAHET